MKYWLALLLDHVLFSFTVGVPMALLILLLHPANSPGDFNAAVSVAIAGAVIALILLPGLYSDVKKAGGSQQLWRMRSGLLWGFVAPVTISDQGWSRLRVIVVLELILSLLYVVTMTRADQLVPPDVAAAVNMLEPIDATVLMGVVAAFFVVSRLALLMRTSWSRTAYLYSVVLILLSSAYEGVSITISASSLATSMMVAFEAIMFFSMFAIANLKPAPKPLEQSNPLKFNSRVRQAVATGTGID